jgi:hypothetical protein
MLMNHSPTRPKAEKVNRNSGADQSPKPPAANNAAGLILNFSPLEFADAEVNVDIFDYGADGDDVLKDLRKKHAATHVFRRDGTNQIVAVPRVQNAPKLSPESKTIELTKNLGLTASLMRNSLLDFFNTRGGSSGFDPITFVGRDDLLREVLPAGLHHPEWLALRLLYEITIRPVYFFKQKPFIAAIINVRTTRIINRTAAQLLADGFPLLGHYVTQRIPHEDPRMAPREQTLGKVENISGEELLLTDSREGIESAKALDVYLQRDVFNECLRHVFKEDSEAIISALDEKRAELRAGPAMLERIGSVVDFLSSRQHYMLPDVPFEFTPLLSDTNRDLFPAVESIPKPFYIFDPTGSKSERWHDGGLSLHGPYTANTFTPNRPRVCVVCQRAHKGDVEKFLRKFISGVQLPAPSANYRGKPPQNYFEKGFLRKYALQDVTYEFFIAEASTAAAYRSACEQAIEKQGIDRKWDLALVQIEESFHELEVTRNPYYICKSSFLTHQIPVQEFEIETAYKKDSQLAFCLNNMALATYAKMNGIPWLLQANRTIAHELVIGLGSAMIGEGRLRDRERYVGITTVFSGDGNYHLSNVSRAAPMEEYKSTFLDALRKAITKVRQDMNWQPKDHVRLIFHATFKRYNQDEVDSVKELMSELGDYEVEYAFLQISQNHPYLLFDRRQKGLRDFDTGRTKGIYAPPRSLALQLSNKESLLCLTGASEVKRPDDGLPRPLFLSLHRDSSFMDMTYLTRQVFAFACHSWRTFLPASKPVTVQYSDLIANTLGHLAQGERWNPDVMLGRIGKSRWFL